jgi:hypothetical protein
VIDAARNAFMRNNAFSLRPRNSLRLRNDAMHARDDRCVTGAQAMRRSRTSRYVHHFHIRDSNARSRKQMVRHNFARAILWIDLARSRRRQTPDAVLRTGAVPV